MRPAFEIPSLLRSDEIRRTHFHHGFRVVGRARRRFTRGYSPQPLRGHNIGWARRRFTRGYNPQPLRGHKIGRA